MWVYFCAHWNDGWGRCWSVMLDMFYLEGEELNMLRGCLLGYHCLIMWTAVTVTDVNMFIFCVMVKNWLNFRYCIVELTYMHTRCWNLIVVYMWIHGCVYLHIYMCNFCRVDSWTDNCGTCIGWAKFCQCKYPRTLQTNEFVLSLRLAGVNLSYFIGWGLQV